MAWISKHCYHAKNNILICQLMSHKPKFFIGDSVQLRLSSSDTLPQLWKALELHSSQAQGCKSLEKRQGYKFCKDVHPVEGAASQGTPARASSVLGFKPCSAGAGAAGTPTQAPPACTGRAGAAPAPRSSPAPPASTEPAELSACPSRAVPFTWLEHHGKTPLASQPCAGSLLRADTFPSCSEMTSHPSATALPGNRNL